MNLAEIPHAPTIFEKYMIGSITPFIATAVSFLPDLEAWLRIAALLTGIIVSVLSFVSAELEKRRRRQQQTTTTEENK